jgi:hypothetical protein
LKPAFRVFILVALLGAMPVFADLAPAGDPVPVGSWAQHFYESGVGLFDRMEIEMLTAGVQFVQSGFMDFTNSGWGSQLVAATRAVATGPAVDWLAFDIHFSPELITDPLAFRFTAWNNGVLLETVDASWNGSAWTMETTSENCLTVPESTTALLRGGWLLGLAALAWKRRNRSNG